MFNQVYFRLDRPFPSSIVSSVIKHDGLRLTALPACSCWPTVLTLSLDAGAVIASECMLGLNRRNFCVLILQAVSIVKL